MTKEDKCIHCGADYSLHNFETDQCPLHGIEETRPNHKQVWAKTTFSLVSIASLQTELTKAKEENEALRNENKSLRLELQHGSVPAEDHVFSATIRNTERVVWQYWFTDAKGLNQHSKYFDSKEEALEAFRKTHPPTLGEQNEALRKLLDKIASALKGSVKETEKFLTEYDSLTQNKKKD